MNDRIIKPKNLLVTILIFTIFWNCEEIIDPLDEPDLYPDLGLTQEDSLEAEIIAYYLDQSLTASDSSFKRELYLLNFLRQTYRDSFPFVDDLRFGTPWVPNMILVGAEDSILVQMKNDNFQGWGSILPDMRPDSVGHISSSGFGELYLNPGYHPVLISEYYEVIPGVEYAEPNGLFWTIGPYFPLAIIRGDTSNKYLFSLITYPYPYTYHLFNYVDQQPNYLGSSAGTTDTEYRELISEFENLGFP